MSDVTPADFVRRLKRGEPPTRPRGLFGRLGRLKPGEEDVRWLGDDAGRPLVWLFGDDALSTFDAAAPRELARAVGKKDADLDASLRRGERWTLVVCRAPEARRVTWDSLFDLAGRLVPDAKPRLERHRARVTRARCQELLGDALDAGRAGLEPDAPNHVSTGRFLAGPDTPERLRLWLWHTLGVSELFAGDGEAEHASGGRGFPEFIAPNRPRRDEDAVILLDMR